MLTSTNIPLPKVNSTFLYLSNFYTDSPVGLKKAKGISKGDTLITAPLNSNACYLDVLSCLGSGSIAVAHGLVISAGSGLSINITAGTAYINGPVQLATATTAVVNASTTNYIWIGDSGVITVVNGSITPPGSSYAYLGAAITDGSGVTSVDFSGVVYIKNGIAYREVGDTDQPLDTPPSDWRGFTKTVKTVYFWDGTSYYSFAKGSTPGNGYKAITGTKSDADYTLANTEYSNEIIKLAWTGWTTGRNVVVPTVAGAKWVINNTTGYTATIKTSGGSGIAIANNKHAIVYCDGTNIVRITSDT